ncbi:hypothetical protein PUNSTDRAFT_134130 [Punctularia strigosozonata HHB-11173 SS5]|uniref:uncharacterized protein n=1 Tax=Punctularia strigosozonata (strain HHB-11173) TaxID=741275 RepID=UPI0004416B99|nr:uncharacterized protein PUNSTDRAFT_134130 [Punctularia strigosozonata HHB-11173 SS5]EIN08957.1 hypothetical protein PUNSTDRAFT_134130 [Punctularia strigosozonata HHB-11173 SS5]
MRFSVSMLFIAVTGLTAGVSAMPSTRTHVVRVLAEPLSEVRLLSARQNGDCTFADGITPPILNGQTGCGALGNDGFGDFVSSQLVHCDNGVPTIVQQCPQGSGFFSIPKFCVADSAGQNPQCK